MYGVGDEVETQTLQSIEKDIDRLNKVVYDLKVQFKHLFPESLHHEISEDEKVKFGQI
jgi:hypothetical protein